MNKKTCRIDYFLLNFVSVSLAVLCNLRYFLVIDQVVSIRQLRKVSSLYFHQTALFLFTEHILHKN